MAKFKVGDVVKPLPSEDGYLHPYLIAGKNYIVEGYAYEGEVDVSGEFLENGNGHGWDVDWFELAESKASAESLRNSILEARSKREALQKEILRLDEQEKESVEKLKEQGFVLYEDNVSKELDVKELVVTEKKAVLYAEDIEEDMTNPENWKVGDKFTVLSVDDVGLGVPEDLSLMDIQCLTATDSHGDIPMYALGDSGSAWVTCDQIKFHSRLVK